MRGLKFLLVDDHPIVRSGLRGLLCSAMDAQIVEARDGKDALSRLRLDKPDFVLLDLMLPGIGGLELLRRMLSADQTTRLLVLSMQADPVFVTRAMALGAHGYLSKAVSAEELLTAVRRVFEGGRYIESEIAQKIALQRLSPGHGFGALTESDTEIMRLLANGKTLAEIGKALDITYKQVTDACNQIKAKLGVTRTNDLLRQAIRLSVIASHPDDISAAPSGT
jgi:two-component system, NarL family, invasion response regulator UvrY